MGKIWWGGGLSQNEHIYTTTIQKIHKTAMRTINKTGWTATDGDRRLQQAERIVGFGLANEAIALRAQLISDPSLSQNNTVFWRRGTHPNCENIDLKIALIWN